MAWSERADLRARRRLIWQDEANPRRFRSRSSLGSLCYQDDRGDWQLNDIRLLDDADSFSLKLAAAAHRVRIAESGAYRLYPRRGILSEYIDVGAPNPQKRGPVSWEDLPLGPLSLPEPARARFERSDYTWQVRPHGDGIKAELVIADSAIPRHLRWAVNLTGLEWDKEQLGGADGAAVAFLRPFRAYDANGEDVPLEWGLKSGFLEVEFDSTGLQYPITIDPSFTDGIAASENDARENGGTMIIDGLRIRIGGAGEYGGWRWVPGIAQGSTIDTAVVSFFYDNQASDDAGVTFYCDDVDDAAAFRTIAKDISKRAATTATVQYTDQGIAAGGLGRYDGPELKTLFQEIVDRAGYADTSAMALIAEHLAHGGASDWRTNAWDIDPAEAAILDITWTEAGGGGVSGSGGITIDGPALEASGAQTLSGSGDVTISAPSLEGSESVALQASGAMAVGAPSLSGSGLVGRIALLIAAEKSSLGQAGATDKRSLGQLGAAAGNEISQLG